jgi:hypothetical protein
MNIITRILTICGILVFAVVGSGVAASDSKYMLTENYGGNWVDAEKSPTNNQDNNMCWAAAASNVLDWTGWGHVDGLSNTDALFGYYQNHWEDAGSLPVFAWEWFFEGVNSSQSWSGWAKVDVAGGGFYKSEDYWSQYYDNMTGKGWDTAGAMSAVDRYLRAGYGTTMEVYSATVSHAVTVWGFNYNPDASGDYKGVWITDSDDKKNLSSPTDDLVYYEIKYNTNKWYLQNYYGYNDIYIGGVQALAIRPVPEPATLLGFGLPILMIGLGKLRRNR